MILCILGSSAPDSVSRRVLELAADRIRAAGEPCELLDLSQEFPARHRLADYDDPPPGSQTAALRDRIARAGGVVLATPVYHGSYSGLLKNALDHLAGDAFADLPVALIAAGGGPRGAGTACDQMRSVVRALSGWAVPTHVAATGGDFAPGEPMEGLRERLDDMVAELLSFRSARRPHRPAVRDHGPARPLREPSPPPAFISL
ncbi:NADPH-dependent FMN reductase [Streptomyces sp. NBC_01408]|uniref:NADPH-dependent FMN reductase n=1 Tax=Streptomyces sp. NBC_01408 TaxID=2903855 RepID=UPI002255FEE2|nr:NADPH-dependent FMN reductase [Streptomyces sp. NBC_01408]MCX4696580.1 NAD(P)H-dependent oxidoreductase [Streptomyces sp. NBC_01408]